MAGQGMLGDRMRAKHSEQESKEHFLQPPALLPMGVALNMLPGKSRVMWTVNTSELSKDELTLNMCTCMYFVSVWCKYVCVSVCMCVGMCVYQFISMWMPQVDVRCLLLLLSTLCFETRSLSELGAQFQLD